MWHQAAQQHLVLLFMSELHWLYLAPERLAASTAVCAGRQVLIQHTHFSRQKYTVSLARVSERLTILPRSSVVRALPGTTW